MSRLWKGKKLGPDSLEEEEETSEAFLTHKKEEKEVEINSQDAPMTERIQQLEIEPENQFEEADLEVERKRRPRREVIQAEIIIQNDEAEKSPPVMIEQKVVLKEEPEEIKAEESEEESEEVSESESEEEAPIILPKPVFISKKDRQNFSKEKREEDILKEKERKLQETEERRKESLRIIETQIKQELKEKLPAQDASILEVDDTDGLDPEAEYNEWKTRELNRIKKREEEREKYYQEKEEIEKRRQMTDEERRQDELKQGIDRFNKDRKQQNFLQKYYHKGAFYQDEEILQRDYSAPTLEDKIDKKTLPEVLQKRNFGKMAQSKWTHLAAEDTSKRDSGWFQDSNVNQKLAQKRAGMHDNKLDKPKGKKMRSEDH